MSEMKQAVSTTPGTSHGQAGHSPDSRRPIMDSVEMRFPSVAGFALRGLLRMPAPVRSRVLSSAFARAEAAFNRGDFESVFALFAENVEYVPPPALHSGPPIYGRANVLRFWEDVLVRYERNQITNLSIEAITPTQFARRARLSHSTGGNTLDYDIRQTTEVRRGRVVRQVNEAS